MNNYLLSIVVPTIGRRKNIQQLLESLFVSDLSNVHSKKQIEIIISENRNDNESELTKTINNFPKTIVKLFLTPEFFHTAEENLMWSVRHASGKYLLFLGDDDPINVLSLKNLLEMLNQENWDAMFWNSNLLDPQGNLVLQNRINCELPELKVSIEEFACRAGIWYALSGFSTWVVKRNLFSSDEGLLWVRSFESQIYTHVSFLIMKLKNKKFKFVNKPMVNYRMNLSDFDSGNKHWFNYAKKKNFYLRKPWLAGFIQQLIKLENMQAIQNDFFVQTFEQDHTGQRETLFVKLVSLLNEQLILSSIKKNQVIPSSDLDLILDYFAGKFPEFVELWSEIRLLNETILKSSLIANLFRINYVKSLKINSRWEHFRNNQAICYQWNKNRILDSGYFSDINLNHLDELQKVDFGLSEGKLTDKSNNSKNHFFRPIFTYYLPISKTRLLASIIGSYTPRIIKPHIKKLFNRILNWRSS